MNEQQKNEYIAMLKSEFLDNVDAGMKNTTAMDRAKESVNAAYPEIARLLYMAIRGGGTEDEVIQARSMAASMNGLWKRLYQVANERRNNNLPLALPEPLDDAPPASKGTTQNGSRQRVKPGLVIHAQSGKSNVAQTVCEAIKAVGYKPGDVIRFGDLRLWGWVAGFSLYAIPNLVTGAGNTLTLIREGYQFEVVDPAPCNYTVKLVALPQTAREIEIAALEAEHAKLAAKIAALKNGK